MNIVIVGVGGQGSLLTSQILGALFIKKGLEVKVNEVHGMSQRGGNVVTMVRAGEQVYSPLVSPGKADLLIGLVSIEAFLFVRKWKSCFVNTDDLAGISQAGTNV